MGYRHALRCEQGTGDVRQAYRWGRRAIFWEGSQHLPSGREISERLSDDLSRPGYSSLWTNFYWTRKEARAHGAVQAGTRNWKDWNQAPSTDQLIYGDKTLGRYDRGNGDGDSLQVHDAIFSNRVSLSTKKCHSSTRLISHADNASVNKKITGSVNKKRPRQSYL
jgi:hypothetical protein